MEKQTLELFVLALRSYLDKVATVSYFTDEDKAHEALDSISEIDRCKVDIKFGKAVFETPTESIDFWRDSKEDSWFRAELQKVKWLKIN